MVRLDVAANNVANANTDNFTPSSVVTSTLPGGGVASRVVPGDVEGVDLATEMVGMMVASATFAANAKMLATNFQVERKTLDVLA